MAHFAPAEDLRCLESEDALSAGALGFMPRILVLTTLPHRRPESLLYERVNGRHTLRMRAPRRIGLPYGVYPRLLLVYLTTQAVRTKSPEIQIGATPNDLARKLGLSVISGPRGTATRLQEQLRRLLSMRLEWQTSLGLAPKSSGATVLTASGTGWWKPLQQLLPSQPEWQSHITLTQDFFEEITRSAVPVDFRAIRQLQKSPLAIDLYLWLTYRMSYLKKPTVIPWQSLEAQFGSNYARLRDFRRRALKRLQTVIRIYPALRLHYSDDGLILCPSPPHIGRRKQHRSGSRDA
jgi:hypothetical protein